MRLPSRRLTAAVLVAGLLLAGACSDDGGGDDDAGKTTTTAADEASTTTGAEEGSSTTAGEASTTTTGDDEGSTTVPGTAGEPVEGSGAPDAEAPDVDWSLNAAEYRGQDGRRIAFLCPPDGEIGSVWGTDTYTDDSSVCSAAVHQGIINTEEGGRVVVEIAPGEGEYEGSEANGVTSDDYATWAGSFTFPPS